MISIAFMGIRLAMLSPMMRTLKRRFPTLMLLVVAVGLGPSGFQGQSEFFVHSRNPASLVNNPEPSYALDFDFDQLDISEHGRLSWGPLFVEVDRRVEHTSEDILRRPSSLYYAARKLREVSKDDPMSRIQNPVAAPGAAMIPYSSYAFGYGVTRPLGALKDKSLLAFAAMALHLDPHAVNMDGRVRNVFEGELNTGMTWVYSKDMQYRVELSASRDSLDTFMVEFRPELRLPMDFTEDDTLVSSIATPVSVAGKRAGAWAVLVSLSVNN